MSTAKLTGSRSMKVICPFGATLNTLMPAPEPVLFA
jgi:hypothetical protein